jgi:hypothetical protein
MCYDPNEIFRFIWENRGTLGLREEAYTRVLSVRPCVRVGVDGFMLRETVAEYYQVANLTIHELHEFKIKVPSGLAELLKADDQNLVDMGPDNTDGHEDDGLSNGDDGADAKTIALQGGGTLIFDEYGRLKYHISNDVFQAKRQSTRLSDLFRFGFFRASRRRGVLTTSGSSISTMHRLRSLDGTRMQGEEW